MTHYMTLDLLTTSILPHFTLKCNTVMTIIINIFSLQIYRITFYISNRTYQILYNYFKKISWKNISKTFHYHDPKSKQ